jgi:hypothetical protein
MLPVVPFMVAIVAVIAFKIFVAKLPVTVKLLAVVDPIVDEPDTFRLVKYAVAKERMLPSMLVTVVDPNVELPVVNRFPNAPIPVTVVEPELSEVTFPV